MDTHLTNWREAIGKIEAEHCRAFVARDLDRLEQLWADELLVNSPINRIHDKKRVLELVRAGKIGHVALECQAEALLQQGPFVVVMGLELVEDAGGKQYRRRYTNVWRTSEGTWKLVARHANVISDSVTT